LIEEACDNQRIFAIYGMGGSGKTQTASFFAEGIGIGKTCRIS
jgi:dephospho-CoA kinase